MIQLTEKFYAKRNSRKLHKQEVFHCQLKRLVGFITCHIAFADCSKKIKVGTIPQNVPASQYANSVF